MDDNQHDKDDKEVLLKASKITGHVEQCEILTEVHGIRDDTRKGFKEINRTINEKASRSENRYERLEQNIKTGFDKLENLIKQAIPSKEER